MILRWARAVAQGFYRSLVLVGLTVMPIASHARPSGSRSGSLFTLSWFTRLTSPLIVKALVTVGELAVADIWVAVVGWFMLLLANCQALSTAARRCARRWLALPIEVSYRPACDDHPYGHRLLVEQPPVRNRAGSATPGPDTAPAPGSWLRRDAIWFLVAAVTVVPVTALPWQPGRRGVPGGDAGGAGIRDQCARRQLVIAPFAWRILGPVASRFLGPPPQARLDKRVEEPEPIRADLTHTQAAELERIEQGLHHEAQARLIALGKSMGAAEHLIDADPEAAKAILAQARASSVAAITELQPPVRSINPPARPR